MQKKREQVMQCREKTNLQITTRNLNKKRVRNRHKNVSEDLQEKKRVANRRPFFKIS